MFCIYKHLFYFSFISLSHSFSQCRLVLSLLSSLLPLFDCSIAFQRPKIYSLIAECAVNWRSHLWKLSQLRIAISRCCVSARQIKQKKSHSNKRARVENYGRKIRLQSLWIVMKIRDRHKTYTPEERKTLYQIDANQSRCNDGNNFDNMSCSRENWICLSAHVVICWTVSNAKERMSCRLQSFSRESEDSIIRLCGNTDSILNRHNVLQRNTNSKMK